MANVHGVIVTIVMNVDVAGACAREMEMMTVG